MLTPPQVIFFLRKSTLPAPADIRHLIPVSEDTLLINATHSLIWFDLKNEKVIRTRDLSGDISAVAYGKK